MSIFIISIQTRSHLFDFLYKSVKLIFSRLRRCCWVSEVLFCAMASDTVVSAVSFQLYIVIISRYRDHNTFLMLTHLAIKVILILIAHTPGNLTLSFDFSLSDVSLNIKNVKAEKFAGLGPRK